jgi:hypothetical protein
MDGGGGTTLPSARPAPPWLVRGLTEFMAVPAAGGGGTTSAGPNILPTTLFMSVPVPACVGGGGTTVREGS